MQSRKLARPGRMNIAKEKHVFESILALLFISAATFECFRISDGAKEHVPQWDVREIVGVMMELMVHLMRFRPLENETNPRRRFDIPMIKELSDCDENGVITSGAHAGAEQWIQNGNSRAGRSRSAKMQPAAIPKIISIFIC